MRCGLLAGEPYLLKSRLWLAGLRAKLLKRDFVLAPSMGEDGIAVSGCVALKLFESHRARVD